MVRVDGTILAKRFFWTATLSLLLGLWVGYLCGRVAGWQETLQALDTPGQFIDVSRIPQRKRYVLCCHSGQYGVLADPVAPWGEHLFVKGLNVPCKEGDRLQRP